MQKDERDLLDVLKAELEFLKNQGYRREPETAWRSKYVFEDSPSCINYHSEGNPRPCAECALSYLVPPVHRSAKFPCRHISLNSCGETLDSLYRYSDRAEIENTVGTWLRNAIQRMEEERMAVKASHNSTGLKGTPLYTKQHPKCANPGCSTVFHWTGGGKFFRFRPDPDPSTTSNSGGPTREGAHGVRHYWLCERCTHVFTLAYDEPNGVIIKLLWPEIVAEPRTKASAA